MTYRKTTEDELALVLEEGEGYLLEFKQRADTENMLLNLGVGEFKKKRFYLNQTGVLFFSKEPTQRCWMADCATKAREPFATHRT